MSGGSLEHVGSCLEGRDGAQAHLLFSPAAHTALAVGRGLHGPRAEGQGLRDCGHLSGLAEGLSSEPVTSGRVGVPPDLQASRHQQVLASPLQGPGAHGGAVAGTAPLPKSLGAALTPGGCVWRQSVHAGGLLGVNGAVGVGPSVTELVFVTGGRTSRVTQRTGQARARWQVRKPRREPLGEASPAPALTLDFQPLELQGEGFLLWEPSSLQYLSWQPQPTNAGSQASGRRIGRSRPCTLRLWCAQGKCRARRQTSARSQDPRQVQDSSGRLQANRDSP